MSEASVTTVPVRRRYRWLGILLAICLLVFAGFRLLQHRSDGPLTDLVPGGPLRSGVLVSDPTIDPAFDGVGEIELQLETPARSRYVGLMDFDGALYVPCDLGFMWGRFEGPARHVLHLVYRFKNWHQNVLEDNRVVIRYDGKRYQRRAVRVTDPDLIAPLKVELERLAVEYFEVEDLAPAPTEGPRDIWFFRLEPRES